MVKARQLVYSLMQFILFFWIAVKRVFTRPIRHNFWVILFLVSILLAITAIPAFSQYQSQTGIEESINIQNIRQEFSQLQERVESLSRDIDNLTQNGNASTELADKLISRGQLQFQIGQPYLALTDWQDAEAQYKRLQDESGILQSKLLQTRALRKLGFYPRACKLLVQILDFQKIDEGISQQLCQNQNIPIDSVGINEEGDIYFRFLVDAKTELMSSTGSTFNKQSGEIKITTLRNLGLVLRNLGNLDASQVVLDNPLGQNDAPTILSLANTLYAKGNLAHDRIAKPNYDAMPWRFEKLDISEASDSESFQNSYQQVKKLYLGASIKYQRAAALSKTYSFQLSQKATSNQISLLIELSRLFDGTDTNYWQDATDTLEQLDLKSLPLSQERIFLKLNLAKQLTFLNSDTQKTDTWMYIQQLLNEAEEEAQITQNSYAKSYALASLGGFYEYCAWLIQQDFSPLEDVTNPRILQERSIELTEEALELSKKIHISSATYQWQWQLGRLTKAITDTTFPSQREKLRKQAIEHYESSVKTLETVRKNLLTVNSDIQFSFRDNVEPVYRGFVDLLIQEPEIQALNNEEERQKIIEENLNEAIEVIDRLQLAELENFLRCNLVDTVKIGQNIDKVDPNAAFLYPVLLHNRLEVISKIPGIPIQHHSVLVNPDVIEQTLQTLRRGITSQGGDEMSQSDTKIYNWLLKPIEEQIENQASVDTLVFIPDNTFRNLSLSSLFDDEHQQYVVQKNYATVVLPSSQLFEIGHPRKPIKVLAIGVSNMQVIDGRASFSQLQGIEDEIDTIAKVVPTQKLLNEQATEENIRKSILSFKPTSLHFATHGKFSSDPAETFIVIHQDLLEGSELDTLLQFSEDEKGGIDFLSLAACQTADGDNRAVLGLAGIALKTGAQSTLATLWDVEDEMTNRVVEKFYQELSKPNAKVAEAFHQAQLSAFKDKEDSFIENLPYQWAPFILVGNWL